eukprot:jgi/Mesen1/3116/ME000184S02183
MAELDRGRVKDGDNLAAWLYGVDDLRILPFSLEPLGPNDVKIQMKAVGICGSDVHYLKRMECAGFVVKEPMVIGHESAGVVVEVGHGVTRCKVGDAVALEPGIACHRCNHCKTGRYNLCPDMAFFATPPYHGSLAHHVVHPEDLCFVLPDGISLEEGAMCEPLSVGVHACRRAGSIVGANVAILGAGPIGLVTMLVARAFGASRVAITDVDPKRLQFAAQLGADVTVPVTTDPADEAAEVAALKAAAGGSIDVVFDCVGVTKSMRLALQATESGGKVLLVGMGHSEMTLPLTSSSAREVDVIGVFRYSNTYPLCLALLQSKRVDVKPLITHRFGFSQEEVVKAFDVSAQGGDAIKVMFNL